MNSRVEIEIKFKVKDQKNVREFLDNKEFLEKKKILDIYYDTKAAKLYQKGIFIRKRNSKKLDFKFNIDDIEDLGKFSDHSHCDEYSYEIPLKNDNLKDINEVLSLLRLNRVKEASLSNIIEVNNFYETVVIDKTRFIYKDSDFTYSYDYVKNLGKFLEVEKLTDSSENVDIIKKKIKNKVKKLNLEIITTGYNELYYRKYDFKTYLNGRFLLLKDYKKYRKSIHLKE